MLRKAINYITYPVLIAVMVLCLVAVAQAATGNIDATDKWAWGTNAGWINFRPEHGGVTVYSDHLEGYAWAENIGWIRLGTHTGGGPHTYANTAADNYGVNNDANGNLSGYAWGGNVGWINFNPTHGQVTIVPDTGSFDGYAWAENVGWIHFKGTAPAYNVVITSQDTVQTPTGTGAVEFASHKGVLEDLAAVAEGTLPTEGKPDLDFPHGFFSFNITGLPAGETVVVTITLPEDVPVGTEYWKCHDGAWLDVTSLLGDNDGDNVLTLTLTDGGLGDDDGLPNGEIVDPGAPGQQPAKTLTVNKAEAGGASGTVTSDPAGINCGADCTENYLKGTVVTLTAHPGVNSYLASWSGDCSGTGLTTTVTMDADKTCIATFGYPIGGIVVPVNKVALVAPWMGLAALASLAALTVALVRKRKV